MHYSVTLLFAVQQSESTIHTQQSSTFLASGTHFVEDNFSTIGGEGNGFRMIQVCHIYGELYFCYYYISSTSDHRAFHPRGWGPLHTYVHSFFGFPSHLGHRRSTTKQSSLCYAVGSQEAFHLKNSPVISRMASRVSEESSGLRWYFGLRD